MDKIELSVQALVNSNAQPSSFVVVLKEMEGQRRLPVVIGGFEAQSIAIAVEGIKTSRPLTHDLFRNTLQALGVELQEIVISDLNDGVFFGTLVCMRPDGQMLEMDARTSDAIAMAVRYGCPIFTYPFIMDQAGLEWEEGEDRPKAAKPKSPAPDAPLSSYTEDQLKDELKVSLEQEDYERAAEIRDEVKKRKEGSN